MSDLTLHLVSNRLTDLQARFTALELTLSTLQSYIADRFKIDTVKLLKQRIDRIEEQLERRMDELVIDNGQVHLDLKQRIDELAKSQGIQSLPDAPREVYNSLDDILTNPLRANPPSDS